MSFIELFKANVKILYRDKAGFFWTVAMPAIIYIVLALLPLQKIINTPVRYAYYLLPGLIAMAVMQSGIYGLGYWMVELRARGIIKRFVVTPIRKMDLLLAVVCSRLVMIFLQVIALTLIGVLFFHVPFAGNVVSVIIFTALGGSIFLLLGMFISTLADTYQQAAPITAGIGLPLAALGNIFYPVQNFPHALQIIAKILPITYFADGMRIVYLQSFDFNLIAKDILVLVLWLVVLFGLVVWRFKLTE